MDYKEVKTLLDKYFEGHTSLQEEEKLRTYFKNTTDVPSEFAHAQSMFTHFDKEASEQFEGEVKLKSSNRSFYIRMVGVAASLLLVLSLGTYMYQAQQEEKIYAYINGEPITDQAVAIEETKKALLKMSTNMNNGTRDLGHLTKLNEIEELITKSK